MNPYFSDEILIEDDDAIAAQHPYAWINWLLVFFTVIVPAIIFVAVPLSLLAICLLAYINCLIIGFSTSRFLRKGTPASMVPVFFIPYLLLAWPVAIIYFAIFHPYDAYYKTIDKTPSYFDAGIRVQLCVLLFFIGYYSVMFYMLRNEERPMESSIQNPKRLAAMVWFLGMGVISFNAISKVVALPGFVVYLADGFFKYLYGFLFTVGVLIKNISVTARVATISLLSLAVLFYTIGNARFAAVTIVLFFVAGVLFFSGISRKTKVILAVSLVLAFPTYVVIGNTTRTLLGTIGFEDFWYRFQVLKEWRTVKAQTSTAEAFFGRLFFTGGHQIISQTPSEHPYLHFSPVNYAKEVIVSLLPGRFFYYRHYYQGSDILPEYGINVTETSSVEVSLIGNFWLLGGYMPVFIGGIALGLMHGLIVWLLRKSWAVSGTKTFIYFSIFAPSILWSPNPDIISASRDMVYRLMLAWIIYFVVRIFVGDPEYEMHKTMLATEYYGGTES
jgi:hypothetical protein